jgi:nodulation protein A
MLAWENDVSAAGHAALADMLAKAYPRHAGLFGGGRSWSGARPEVRVIGNVGSRPVAHLGLLRRFLRLPDTGASLLVGDVGLVAVDPDFQRRGIGRTLLDQTTQTMTDLRLPFGFLTCGSWAVPFYHDAGWHLLNGQTTRMIDRDHQAEVYRGPAMVLPVHARISDWPHRHAVDRNGQEV